MDCIYQGWNEMDFNFRNRNLEIENFNSEYNLLNYSTKKFIVISERPETMSLLS